MQEGTEIMDMPRAAGWTALETLGISGIAERVHLALLTRRMATASEVAGLLQISQVQVQHSLAHIEHKAWPRTRPNHHAFISPWNRISPSMH